MLIKEKSLVVALTAGCIISAVLILTRIGYAFYTKIREGNSKRSYEYSLKKIHSQVRAK